MTRQKTIQTPVSMEGEGLFTGQACTMRFAPAEADSGITFYLDGHEQALPALVANVVDRPRRTCLQTDDAVIETVEHVLAAVAGLGIDNIRIDVSSPETPSTDGSPLPFVEALQRADVQDQDAKQKVFIIDEPVAVSHDDAMLAAMPGPTDCLDIL
ncbi:MAG: UDP-3-O-acyl-N-acetylglucosamine deacetylase, partial [Planctomycetota bacterium]